MPFQYHTIMWDHGNINTLTLTKNDPESVASHNLNLFWLIYELTGERRFYAKIAALYIRARNGNTNFLK